MNIAAIIVAAGRGERAGSDLPKQLRPLGKRPVLQWSIDALRGHSDIDQCVLVVPSGEIDRYRALIEGKVIITEGGETRSASVRAGLAACDIAQDGLVLIHDAARPGLKSETISSLISALSNADAAAPALPVADALKRKSAETLTTIDRSELYRVQTPQAFRLGAITSALGQDVDFVDDLAAIEACNGKVTLIQGDEALGKITYPEDHARLEKLLMPTPSVPRFGTGFDVHALEPGDGVTLCGVKIAHTHSLSGHSDADVAWHALTDAILGAAALGDIGDHFPPSDPQWKGAPSDLFLKHAVDIARDAGWALASCDVTLICEAPKVKPHREAMRQRTAEVTGLELGAVSVKATTTEGLGFTGRREGIAAQASAVL
ncbi:MAG: bifunctional 2-C-methyl-D-erythritol 4-phosphate cytidylyltransferase/2-C-methyl-D-erythritol 2,4-cyclodiphosphate synthase, partial [Pseudomonadota bacterium]